MNRHPLQILLLCLSAFMAPPLALAQDAATEGSVSESATEAAPDEASQELIQPPADIVDTIPVPALKADSAADQVAEPAGVTRLEEIVVTANKRAESTRTLAGAVTAIDSKRLSEAGASAFGDYLSLSPGVNYNSGVPGYSVITIRGVSTDTVPGAAQTAVGVYYDDLPLTDPAAPMVVPDIDAFDAERVELLRGPQGALYGSASLGGAVNYIPEAPDLFNAAFAAQASGNLATNSSLGGGAKLMFNLPLLQGTAFAENGLAIRAVGHYTRTPGYIDNVGTEQEQANESRTGGGRVTLGWAPTLQSELRLTGLYQRTDVDDSGYVDENLGDLKKSTLVPEPSFNEIRLASLRYENEQDYGNWAFIAGYQDKSSLLLYSGADALGIGALGVNLPLQQDGSVKGYSGELRFISPGGARFEWLAGLFYADRTEDFNVSLTAETLQDAIAVVERLAQALNLPILGDAASNVTVFDQNAQIEAPEAAAFVEGTFRFTPAFKLTAGGRYYRNEVDSGIVARGALVLPSGQLVYTSQRKETANGFNPKVSLSWQATDELLLYALYSRGYRLGGPNLVPSSPVTSTEPTYGPDEVDNYELGAKTGWWDGLLTLDFAGFYIDWSDIPLQVVERSGLFKYLDNAGDARIRGLETSLAVRPWEFLTLRTSLTWTDARLLNDYDPRNNRPPARAGDRLPGAPEWTLSNTLTGLWYWGDYTPTLTLIHRYESASATNLSFQDVEKGDFNLFDVRAGIALGAFGITAFAKNITDERAVMASNNYAQATGDVLSLKFINPPRTFGLELSYSFSQQ
ncbi:MAG TPA: TonB-dependent receptor [Fontimonas sp.]